MSDPGTTIEWSFFGITVRNIVQRSMLPSSALPPPAGNKSFPYTDTVDFEISNDGGLYWIPTSAPGNGSTKLTYAASDWGSRFYDGEILSLNIAGGGLPAGFLLRESPTRLSTGKYNVRPVSAGDMVSSFFDVFLEMSVDGGSSWVPASNCITLNLEFQCPTIALSGFPDGWMNKAYEQTITASGGVPPYSFSVAGGALPPGLTLSPEGKVTGTPTDFGLFSVTIGAADSNGCMGTRAYEAEILAPEYFMASSLFPPNGRYLAKRDSIVMWAPGFAIRDFGLRGLTHVGPLPAPGGGTPYSLTGGADIELSTDGGATWSIVHAPTHETFFVNNYGGESYDAEVLQLDIDGGDLPYGVRFRESPTKASTGKLSSVAMGGGYEVSSFFDVWLELTLDGGVTWYPPMSGLPIAATYPTEYPFANDNFPPAGIYKSGQDEPVRFGSALAVKNIAHYGFSGSFPLPILGKSSIYAFTGKVGFDFSLDGGVNWNYVNSASSNMVEVEHMDDDGAGSFYNTEAQQMDISGGGLPTGVMLRESPTKPSTGRYNVRTFGLGDRISSFFDVFLQVSTDGGASWQPAENYVTLSLYSRQTVVTAYQNRWNMVSVPVIPNDVRKSSIFPQAVSDAFAYESGYVKKDTLEVGKGYWVKFSGAVNDTFIGVPLMLDSVAVGAGWNMVGSISEPAAVSMITSVPPGLVTGQFWAYSAGYTAADTIKPGKAYWVKVSGGGALILSTGPDVSRAGRIRIVPRAELPPPPPDGTQGDDRSSWPIPSRFALEQNYPNPFNPATVIGYQLPVDCFVVLKVYNALGEEVATLVSGAQTAGYRSVEFDAGRLASGIYIYKITAGSFSQARKLVVLK